MEFLGEVENEQTTDTISLKDIPGSPIALDFCDKLLDSGNDLPDWKERIHRRFKSEEDYHVLAITRGDDPAGFVLISKNPGKLNKWNNKFLKQKWLSNPINPNTSAQFAYFYVLPDKRNNGLGTTALKATFEWCQSQGITTLIGFTRYEQSLPLYQRHNCQILGKNTTKTGTYFKWDINVPTNIPVSTAISS